MNSYGEWDRVHTKEGCKILFHQLSTFHVNFFELVVKGGQRQKAHLLIRALRNYPTAKFGKFWGVYMVSRKQNTLNTGLGFSLAFAQHDNKPD